MTERRRYSEQARWRRDLILVAALVLGLFGGYVLIQNQQDTHDEQIRMENRDAILDGIEANCRQDRHFRLQYKHRGKLEIALTKAEVSLLELFLGLAQATVDTGIPPDQVKPSEDFIERFAPLTRELGPLLRRVRILSVPRCGDQRREIEAQLEAP